MRARGPIYLALLGQVLISGTTYVLAKLALRSFGSMEVLLLRFAGSLPLFVVMLAVRPGPRLPPRRLIPTLVALGLLGLPLNQGLFLKGLESTTPNHAGLLYALSPLLVFIISVLLGLERVTGQRIVGLLLAFTGVVVVLSGRGSGDESGAHVGDALIAGGVLCWALYTVFGHPLAAELGSIRVTAWTAIAGSLVSLPFLPAVLRVDHLASATPAAWWALGFLCVFTSFLSYLLWTFALARIDASRTAVWSNLQPVATAALSYLAYGTPVTGSFAVGGLLALVGVFLTQRD